MAAPREHPLIAEGRIHRTAVHALIHIGNLQIGAVFAGDRPAVGLHELGGVIGLLAVGRHKTPDHAVIGIGIGIEGSRPSDSAALESRVSGHENAGGILHEVVLDIRRVDIAPSLKHGIAVRETLQRRSLVSTEPVERGVRPGHPGKGRVGDADKLVHRDVFLLVVPARDLQLAAFGGQRRAQCQRAGFQRAVLQVDRGIGGHHAAGADSLRLVSDEHFLDSVDRHENIIIDVVRTVIEGIDNIIVDVDRKVVFVGIRALPLGRRDGGQRAGQHLIPVQVDFPDLQFDNAVRHHLGRHQFEQTVMVQVGHGVKPGSVAVVLFEFAELGRDKGDLLADNAVFLIVHGDGCRAAGRRGGRRACADGRRHVGGNRGDTEIIAALRIAAVPALVPAGPGAADRAGPALDVIAFDGRAVDELGTGLQGEATVPAFAAAGPGTAVRAVPALDVIAFDGRAVDELGAGLQGEAAVPAFTAAGPGAAVRTVPAVFGMRMLVDVETADVQREHHGQHKHDRKCLFHTVSLHCRFFTIFL